jgi:hypothetical protein
MIDHLLKSTTLICLTFLLPHISYGFEHWYVSTEKQVKTLIVTNRKAQAQVLWIAGPIKQLPTDPDEKLEQAFTVEAYANLEIPLLQFQKFPWVHLKTENPGVLQISAFTSSEQQVFINPGSHNRWMARPRPESELILMNLAPFRQKIKVSDMSQAPEHQLMIDAPAFSSQRLSLPDWSFGRSLVIEGEARIQGFLLNPKASQSLMPSRQPTSLKNNPEKAYFRLSNPENSQSYVVGLDDITLIQQAREQIASPSSLDKRKLLARILIAEIDYGSGQENRDWSQAVAPLWSWHISHVYNFSQLAHQDCDGSPEMLEELLQIWREGSRTICFWNYHVVEELKSTPSSKHPVPAFLQPSP